MQLKPLMIPADGGHTFCRLKMTTALFFSILPKVYWILMCKIQKIHCFINTFEININTWNNWIIILFKKWENVTV